MFLVNDTKSIHPKKMANLIYTKEQNRLNLLDWHVAYVTTRHRLRVVLVNNDTIAVKNVQK